MAAIKRKDAKLLATIQIDDINQIVRQHGSEAKAGEAIGASRTWINKRRDKSRSVAALPDAYTFAMIGMEFGYEPGDYMKSLLNRAGVDWNTAGQTQPLSETSLTAEALALADRASSPAQLLETIQVLMGSLKKRLP